MCIGSVVSVWVVEEVTAEPRIAQGVILRRLRHTDLGCMVWLVQIVKIQNTLSAGGYGHALS